MTRTKQANLDQNISISADRQLREKVLHMADGEQRTLAQMGRILLMEALEARRRRAVAEQGAREPAVA